MIGSSDFGFPLELEEFSSVLGTRSAQKTLQILACWEALPAKEIVSKTELDESQIISTLHDLEKLNIIEINSLGNYKIASNSFTTGLRQAYLEMLKQAVGKQLYQLTKSLDNLTNDQAAAVFASIASKWKPILDKYYRSKTSSLANYIVDTA